MNFKALVLSVFVGAAAVVASAPAQAEQVTPACVVANVATFKDRFHVKCNFLSSMMDQKGQPPGKKLAPYYAVETNSPLAASAVHIALAALLNKRMLTIHYDENPNNNPSGCAKDDCRRLIGLEVD